MALRKKAQNVLQHSPDLLIVPECEHPDKLNNSLKNPTGIIWKGTNINKGIGVFAFNNYSLELLECYDPSYQYILPIKVCVNESQYLLLAVWAFNPKDPAYNYIGQVWKALHYYEVTINEFTNVIIAGDFNSNVLWDKLGRRINHTMVVEKLKNLNIHSAYHHHHNLLHGMEKHPSFYMYRHQEKSYHIDYCFLSETLLSNVNRVEVGEHKEWCMYSDHTPLIVTIA